VVVNNQVLDVTSFLDDHPGGMLAMLSFAGKDATDEFNMIHPEGVIDKYAPTSVIGSLAGGEVARKPAAVAASTSSKPSGPGCFAAIVSSLCGK